MDKDLAKRILDRAASQLPTRKQWGKVFKVVREIQEAERKEEQLSKNKENDK